MLHLEPHASLEDILLNMMPKYRIVAQVGMVGKACGSGKCKEW